MKISKSSSNQQAEPNTAGVFVVGSKNSDNTKTEYREFKKIEEAASWLCLNPTWGIRMNPGWSLIYLDIVIDLS